jgi:hypothetical protein
MIQKAVAELREISPKLTEELDEAQLEAVEKCVKALVRPLSHDDVRILISLLPGDGDSAFGLNWPILHAIEAAPGWPYWDLLGNERNAWVRRFRTSLANAGIHPPAESDSASA